MIKCQKEIIQIKKGKWRTLSLLYFQVFVSSLKKKIINIHKRMIAMHDK